MNRIRTLKWILLVTGNLLACSVVAQTFSNNSSGKQAPGTGICTVDLYSGTAAVNIPIYAYNIDGIDAGVSLSYDTRGIKLDQIADNTGLGWTLHAGGEITRELNGVEDEVRLAGMAFVNQNNDTTLHYGLQGRWCSIYGGAPDKENVADLFNVTMADQNFRFWMDGIGSNNYQQKAAYSVFPKSGILPIVYENFHQVNGSISRHYIAQVGTFDGIPAGTQYTHIDNYVNFVFVNEKNDSFFYDRGDQQYKFRSEKDAVNPYTYYPVTRWVLTQIKSHTGQVVTYTYTTLQNVAMYISRDESVKEVIDHNENSIHYNASINKEYDSLAIWRGNISQLSRIDYSNGTSLIFEYDNANPRCDIGLGGFSVASGSYVTNGYGALKSIKIESKYDASFGNSLTYRFNYAYFHTPVAVNTVGTELPYNSPCNSVSQGFNTSTDPLSGVMHQLLGLRLKLNSIDRIGSDNTTTERYYSFVYNTTPLAERLSPGKDYYEYYNGKTSTYQVSGTSNPDNLSHKSSIPLHTFNLSSTVAYTYGVDKTPDFSYAIADNLIKVTNDKGASAWLFYKEHQLYDPANSYGNAYPPLNTAYPLPDDFEAQNANDGICIDRIAYDDGYNLDNKLLMQYNFQQGERFFRGLYFWEPIYYVSQPINPTVFNTQISYTVFSRNYYNSNICPRPFINGFNHGYTYATVVRKGYDNELVDSVKYKFTNLMDENDTTVSNLQGKGYEYSTQGAFPGTHFHRFHPVKFDEYKMGLPLETTTYERNGTLRSITSNVYSSITSRILPADSIKIIVPYAYGNIVSSDIYQPFNSKIYQLIKSTTTMFGMGNSMTSATGYHYDDKDHQDADTTTDSKGNSITNKKFYNYTLINGSPYNNLKSEFSIKSETWKQINGTDYLLASQIATPPTLQENYNNFKSLKIDQPIPAAQYSNVPGLLQDDSKFIYDDHTNVVETALKGGMYFLSSIWDTRIGKKVAEISNARYQDVAYTSFEGPFPASNFPGNNKGNWYFNPSNVEFVGSPLGGSCITGRYAYHLAPGADVMCVNVPQNGRKYKLSYWNYGSSQVKLGNTVIAVSQKNTVRGWTLYYAEFMGNGSDYLTISGIFSYAHIDELRLCPVEATLNTTTYDPLFGMNSACDNLNDITYYEYDAMGRVKIVRDINGNIISFNRTVVQGSDN